MDMLLRKALLNLWDIPHLLTPLGSEGEYYKEASWKLMVLAQGLRSEADLALYRKRRVLEACLVMGGNPYAGERVRERVREVLWSMAEVQGGGGVAVTRNGVVAWAEMMLAGEEVGGVGVEVKKVLGRLVGTAERGHVRAWGKGGVGRHLGEMVREE